jgi:hypothetical protein
MSSFAHLAIALALSAAPVVVPAAAPESPLACDRESLSPAERKRHFDELGPKLRTLRKSVRELPDGYELELPPDPATVKLVMEWAAGERLCCPFFDISIRMEKERGPVRLSLTGRSGVKEMLKADFAEWLAKR